MENETSISASGDLGGSDIDGRYVLKSKLGEGGMGVVYNAIQLSTSREVAFKIVKVDVGDDARLDRFKQEVEIISNLSHPNIVRVIDTGTIPNHNLLYVVMELIEGIPLSDLLWHKHAEGQYFKCRTRMEFALEVTYQLCAALTEPHRQGIIHRDIKPENILISPSSDETVQLKVLDFGIARVLNHSKPQKKMTDSRIPFVGTPHYMAPEQVARSQYDARTDLYAVGVVLFEMLSSQYPFDNDNLLALLLQKTQRDAPSLAEVLPEDHALLQDVIALTDALLSRDQEARPIDAMKVRRMIEDIRDEHRLRRVRIDIHDFFAQRRQHGDDIVDKPEVSDDERLEPYRELYRPWLLYPSGKPLVATEDELAVAAVVDAPEDAEDPVEAVAAEAVATEAAEAEAAATEAAEAEAAEAEAVPVLPSPLAGISPVMPALTELPLSNFAPIAASSPDVVPDVPVPDEEALIDSEVEVDSFSLADQGIDSHTDVLTAPRRNKLKAWHVDINWTNSFNVSDLEAAKPLDVDEMGEYFEEDEEEAEDIEEVVTSIWKPDMSEFPQDLLDSFKSYDDNEDGGTQSEQAAFDESEALDSDRLVTQADASTDLGMVPPGFASLPGIAKHTPDFGAIPLQLEIPSEAVSDAPGGASRDSETVRERALASHVIGQESWPSHSDTIPEPFSIKTPQIQEMLAEAKQLREDRAAGAVITTESGLHSLLPEADLSPSRIAKVALFDDDSLLPVAPLNETPSAELSEPTLDHISDAKEVVDPSLEIPRPAPVEEPPLAKPPVNPPVQMASSGSEAIAEPEEDLSSPPASKLPIFIGVLILLVIVIGAAIALS